MPAGHQALPDQVQLVVEYNDGFVAYLNGVQEARRNGGPVNKFIYRDQSAYNREAVQRNGANSDDAEYLGPYYSTAPS